MIKVLCSTHIGILLLALLAAACSEAKLSDGSVVKSEESADSIGDGKMANEENGLEPMAVPPVAIGGTFLHMECAVEVPPTESSFETLYGCSLKDHNGHRKPADAVFDDYEFGWRMVQASDLRAAVKNLRGDAYYDSVILFKSDSLSALQKSLKGVEILFQDGSRPDADATISADLSQITVDSQSVLDELATNYGRIAKELSELLVVHQPTPPNP